MIHAPTTDIFKNSYAVFSKNGKDRLILYRSWDKERPAATVIGLNPSTADENKDDPTIGFVRRVLAHNGYGQLYMVNLFTMITPHPKELIQDNHPEKAIHYWQQCAASSKDVVFAWGSLTNVRGRDMIAKNTFPEALCFGHLKDGSPRHPMYLKATTELKKYRQ